MTLTPELIEQAAETMAEATSWFVLPSYGVEGLLGLLAAGWTLTPPEPVPAGPGWQSVLAEAVLRLWDRSLYAPGA